MSLLPPPKVQKLQEALHAKAKGSPDHRFHASYDKVCRRDILEWAYVRCRHNDGEAGVDRQSFKDIEAYGLDRWLNEVIEELRNRTYHPQPVRRVYIPKPDGKQRPPGVPRTRLCRVPEETFDFLGHTFGRCDSAKTGRSYPGTKPSAKKVKRLYRSISEMTGRGTTWQPTEMVVAQLNRKLERWANYFCLGSASRAYAAVDRHTGRRLRHWLRIKHKVRERGWSRFPEVFLTETLGFVSLRRRRRGFP